MKCPSDDIIMLLSANLAGEDEVRRWRGHVEACEPCRKRFQEARRQHAELTRLYEVYDHDHDARREQLMAALPEDLPRPSVFGGVRSFRRRLGDMVMKLNTSKHRRTAAVLAPAACVVVAVLILFSHAQERVFADALARFREARTIMCHVSTTIKVRMEVDPGIKGAAEKLPGAGTLKPTETVRNEILYLSDTYGARRDTFEEDALVSTTYTSPEGSNLILNHSDQTFQEFDVDDDLREMAAGSPGPDIHFMALAQNPDRLLRGVQDLTLDAEHELQHEGTDEGDLIGYAIPAERVGLSTPPAGQANRNRAELWIDAESGDVARLVFRSATVVPGTNALPLKASFTMTIVYDRFEFDPPLQEDWFTAQIPDGYTPLTTDGQPTVLHMPDEADLLESLRVFAGIAKRYPSSLSAMDASYEVSFLMGSIQARVINAKRSGKPDPTIPDLATVGKKLQGLALYALLEAQGREPAYFGASVKPGDAQRVLMQWTLDGGDRRVIYGDLRTETLPAP